jgi:hypothetical protein
MSQKQEQKRAEYQFAQFEEWHGRTIYDSPGVSLQTKLVVTTFLWQLRRDPRRGR